MGDRGCKIMKSARRERARYVYVYIVYCLPTIGNWESEILLVSRKSMDGVWPHVYTGREYL
jgi:hypothetical protein